MFIIKIEKSNYYVTYPTWAGDVVKGELLGNRAIGEVSKALATLW
jgi:hypothetical protein